MTVYQLCCLLLVEVVVVCVNYGIGLVECNIYGVENEHSTRIFNSRIYNVEYDNILHILRVAPTRKLLAVEQETSYMEKDS